MSRSAIARVEGVDWHTVDRWLNRVAAFAKRFNDSHLKVIPLVELQADELQSIVCIKALFPGWHEYPQVVGRPSTILDAVSG